MKLEELEHIWSDRMKMQNQENKYVDIFTQDNKLVFHLNLRRKGATIVETRFFDYPLPFGTREGAYLTSFSGRYFSKEDTSDNRLARLEELEQENARLREALEFYAEPYIVDEKFAVLSNGEIDDDCEVDEEKPWRFYTGKRARKALEKSE